MIKELLKKENILIPISGILQKIISNEKLTIPRLKVFEEICPEILYISGNKPHHILSPPPNF